MIVWISYRKELLDFSRSWRLSGLYWFRTCLEMASGFVQRETIGTSIDCLLFSPHLLKTISKLSLFKSN